jgi:hypothetical protein
MLPQRLENIVQTLNKYSGKCLFPNGGVVNVADHQTIPVMSLFGTTSGCVRSGPFLVSYHIVDSSWIRPFRVLPPLARTIPRLGYIVLQSRPEQRGSLNSPFEYRIRVVKTADVRVHGVDKYSRVSPYHLKCRDCSIHSVCRATQARARDLALDHYGNNHTEYEYFKTAQIEDETTRASLGGSNCSEIHCAAIS